jgi:hypothetical protein
MTDSLIVVMLVVLAGIVLVSIGRRCESGGEE